LDFNSLDKEGEKSVLKDLQN